MKKVYIVRNECLTPTSSYNDIIIFHAGTAIKDNKLVTSGGRVLNICAEGKDLQSVRSKLYKAAEVINFDGKYYRKDIGKKAKEAK